MTREEWLNHWKIQGQHDTKTCSECAKRRRTKRHATRQRDRYQAMRSLGLVKTPYGWE